ncbi:MAG TPA: sigma-70 family RNA polymerase sigma factor [Ktedonobacterales bacterium]|nr:sigma-70 family RNA polymerase sigma factor [Ktedonobacterales bacterium]
MARLADGDEAALVPLYDRYGKLIYSLALRVVHDSSTAEEVTQEVFVRLWRNAASFEPSRGRVHAWLMRIAHNLALNEVRRRQSRPVAADSFDWSVAGAALVDQNVDGDPAMATWLRERATAIRNALTKLPAPQRQAIELAFFGGLSQAEVAAAIGDPLGTVKSRIRVGMQRLRELLVADGVDIHSIEVP